MNLTQRDNEVLGVIAAYDPATSNQIRENVGWIEQSSQVNYRFEKLEDEGLIETTSGIDGRRTVVREASLTVEGSKYVKEHDLESEKPLEDRVANLEEKNKKLVEHINAQYAVIGEMERIFDDLGVNMDVEKIVREKLDE